MNIGSIRNITLLNDNPRIGILCAQQRLCSFLGFFFSTRILTRSPPGSSCLRLRTCRICRWGWRCRPSERSPWPQCPELGNHMGLSQNGSKFMVIVILWLFYGYFMVILWFFYGYFSWENHFWGTFINKKLMFPSSDQAI